ncbi:hypothetical protein C8Q79DRAFT_526490 [Trametes meyenii]|nr:hypothetical protein C8Q79DRAFT_526490 [Trametes meyenii]
MKGTLMMLANPTVSTSKCSRQERYSSATETSQIKMGTEAVQNPKMRDLGHAPVQSTSGPTAPRFDLRESRPRIRTNPSEPAGCFPSSPQVLMHGKACLARARRLSGGHRPRGVGAGMRRRGTVRRASRRGPTSASAAVSWGPITCAGLHSGRALDGFRRSVQACRTFKCLQVHFRAPASPSPPLLLPFFLSLLFTTISPLPPL